MITSFKAWDGGVFLACCGAQHSYIYLKMFSSCPAVSIQMSWVNCLEHVCGRLPMPECLPHL